MIEEGVVLYVRSKSGITHTGLLAGSERVVNTQQENIAKIGTEIVSSVLAGYHGPIAVRLWNGRLATGRPDAPCTVRFNHPGVLRELILHHDLQRLVEAFLSGDIAVEGNLECLFEIGPYLDEIRVPWRKRLQLLHLAFKLPVRDRDVTARSFRVSGRIRKNSRASIAHHYDVSNDFYKLWLDPEMVYSCAYFRDASQPLAEAQRDKLDYLCRKLRLHPGQTLLDIGCGWGALALWAARHYGVQVHGITLSREQQRLAQARVDAAGLGDQVRIELLDYRDLDGETQYDRVISVGMFEHVGVKNYPVYFGTVRRVLKPNGLFLNHGITSENGWQRTPLTRFMNHYIFPDGELARIGEVVTAMERAGFEIVDVENLRRHYTLTLHHWVTALESNRNEAIKQLSKTTYRLWRLYMAGCAHYFDAGSIAVHQVLAGQRHSPLPVPLRRNDLYDSTEAGEEVQA
jgi:cyclopropane-fatty-acyl-phospholipid synthase